MDRRKRPLGKREFVQFMASLCAGGSFFGNTVQMMAHGGNRVTRDMVVEAERLAGLRLTEAQREMLVPTLQVYLQNIQYIREVSMPPEMAPSLYFLSDTRGIWTATSKKIREG